MIHSNVSASGLLILLVTIFLGVIDVNSQTQITGRVLDQYSGDPLVGSSVYLEGHATGCMTDFDGNFRFNTRQTGEAYLVVSMLGFESVRSYIQLPVQRGGNLGLARMDMGLIIMKSSTIGLEEANVIASVALDRETPIAVSTIDARTIEEQIGDKELVETLNITPGVYATKSGGGFGDSRINIRGFDQRNVAVLINGIPVNDMENGWVYWSNWAG